MLSEQADMIGQLSVGAGNIVSTGDNLRVFDHLFIGQETIRGFDTRGIGPRVFNGATEVVRGWRPLFTALA